MLQAASTADRPQIAAAARSSAAPPRLYRRRVARAALLAAAIDHGHRAETAVALSGIDPRDAAIRILRALSQPPDRFP